MTLTKSLASDNDCTVYETIVSDGAVTGADMVVTGTWVSLGQEDEYQKRCDDFADYQVNKALMDRANEKVVLLHCLTQHQEEVSEKSSTTRPKSRLG